MKFRIAIIASGEASEKDIEAIYANGDRLEAEMLAEIKTDDLPIQVVVEKGLGLKPKDKPDVPGVFYFVGTRTEEGHPKGLLPDRTYETADWVKVWKEYEGTAVDSHCTMFGTDNLFEIAKLKGKWYGPYEMPTPAELVWADLNEGE